MYDIIIVGCGFSGVVMANLLAKENKKILVIDKRNHIAGNMYDYVDNNGLLIHKYGPHILMLNDESVFKYLSYFTEWIDVKTELETYIDSKFIPLPINFNSIIALYGKKRGNYIINELLLHYEENTSINILDLLNSDSTIIHDFALDIFNKVFVGYNQKMWGLNPEQLDKDVIGRSPIKLSYQNKKANTKYEVVPKNGYTEMFKKMISNKNITLKLKTNAADIIKIQGERILFENSVFNGKMIYTGPIDELFNFKYGKLPYRAIYFKKDIKPVESFYNTMAVTFPQNFKKTRTSEMKKITCQENKKLTALVSEYPGDYSLDSKKFNNPSYPILNKKSNVMIKKYREEVTKIPHLYMTGRLSEFKYFNMEETILSAFRLYEKIKGE